MVVCGARNGREVFDHVLEMAMMLEMPSSGCAACRYHMAEKSPAVHPTRHRVVLTMALFHTGFDDQKLAGVAAADVVVAFFPPAPAVFGPDWLHASLLGCSRTCRP